MQKAGICNSKYTKDIMNFMNYVYDIFHALIRFMLVVCRKQLESIIKVNDSGLLLWFILSKKIIKGLTMAGINEVGSCGMIFYLSKSV